MAPPDPGPAATAPDAAHTSDARLAAASSLRALGHALVAHQADDAVLERVREVADGLTAEVATAPERPHAFARSGLAVFAPGAADGVGPTPGRAFPDCVVSGRANPLGLAATLWREGTEAVCAITLGPAFEGAPGRAHGGVVAALIDETMGLVLSIHSTPAFTGELTVRYRAPTPLGVPLTVRARLAGRAGRKLTITAELTGAARTLAEAEALFVAVDPDHFLDRR